MILSEVLPHLGSEQVLLHLLLSIQSLRDPITHLHAQHLVPLAVAVATELGCPAQERAYVALAAALHDLGKMALPDAILHKPGRLTKQEWHQVQEHPALGAHLLHLAGGSFAVIAPLVLCHHERWDGRGYPNGLVGEQIPLGARILAVIDAYDAMISSRPYKHPLAPLEAQGELSRCAGSHFDPLVVRAFLFILLHS